MLSVRIQKRICRHKMSIMFNEICINEEMLPIYIYIYIYINIYIYILSGLSNHLNFKWLSIYVFIHQSTQFYLNIYLHYSLYTSINCVLFIYYSTQSNSYINLFCSLYSINQLSSLYTSILSLLFIYQSIQQSFCLSISLFVHIYPL